MKATLREMEKVFILNRFSQLNNNRTHTARSLGIGIRTLQRKLKEYGVEPGQASGKPKDPVSEGAENASAI